MLAVTTSTGEAITTAVISAYFLLLAFLAMRRHKRAGVVFYVGASLLALVLTAAEAQGHVFHGL